MASFSVSFTNIRVGYFRLGIEIMNFIDQGTGESEPNPYFFQNLAEAEYVVAVFMYMRLMGYPAEKISILTTYNGQKHLIRDVVNARCAKNPLIGKPSKIDTVDKYQVFILILFLLNSIKFFLLLF